MHNKGFHSSFKSCTPKVTEKLLHHQSTKKVQISCAVILRATKHLQSNKIYDQRQWMIENEQEIKNKA